MKLCNLLGYHPNQKHLKLYNMSFAVPEGMDTVFYKPINELNKKVLVREQLKLSKLKRVKFI